MYDPAAYPLILPHGDAGFSLNNPIAKVNAPSTRATVSLQEFTRFHLQQRTNSFNTLLKSGKLAQVYFCDQYSKIEGRRMHYYCHGHNLSPSLFAMFSLCLQIPAPLTLIALTATTCGDQLSQVG